MNSLTAMNIVEKNWFGITYRLRVGMLYVVAVMFATGCTDVLIDEGKQNSDDSQGLLFDVSTVEMGQQMMPLGSTASTRGVEIADSIELTDDGNHFKEFALQGYNPYGLKLQRQPLPLMGIHHSAASMSVDHSEEPTRATANEVVTGITNFHDSLTIWGYTDNGTNLFDQIILTKVRNWRNSVEWPYNQGDYMKFCAVSPSLESLNILSTDMGYNSGTHTFTLPTLTYTLPEKSNELIDVLYGESENISIAAGPAGTTSTNPEEENLGKDNKHVNLQFRHIMTAVRFSQGTIPTGLRITEISVEGIPAIGTFDPAVTDPTTATMGKWTIPVSPVTHNYTISTDFLGDGAAISNVYIDNDQVLFLLPQTLPSGAQLRIKLTDTTNSREHTLTCSLNGDAWKKGYTVNYKITIGRMVDGYYFNADPNVELEHSTNAVSGTLAVHSYQLFYDYSSGSPVPTYEPVAWDILSYSTDGEDFVNTNPAWLTDFHGVLQDSHYQGGKDALASFTVAGQEYKFNADHDVVLSANNVGASALDLSRKYPYMDGGDYPSWSPANCYIVNRIGSYVVPLVYGNMTSDNATQKPCFKDHAGNTITKYKIREQIGAKKDEESHGTTEYLWSAIANSDKNLEPTLQIVLLWEDVQGLITSITANPNPTSGNNTAFGEIGFTVSKSTPGNAVLALQARKVTYDGGDYGTLTSTSANSYGPWETVWTWHIWMTDEVYRNNGTSDENSYDAFYVNGSTSKDGSGKYIAADHIAQVKDAGGANTDKILPVNLGWVPDAKNFGVYEARSVWVKLKQTDTEVEPAVVKITQNARQDLYTGTGTIYQWGRPTAFPALRTLTGSTRTIYDISGNNITSRFVLAQAISGAGYGGDAISNTYGVLQWESNPNSWFDLGLSEYVTANAMWNSSEKTVYDPCPPGFRVPPASVFYVFSKTGTTVQSGAEQLNMYPEIVDLNGVTQKNGERTKGGYFYLKPYDDSGDTEGNTNTGFDRYADMVYMPATGEWHGNKVVGTQLQDASEQLNQTNGLFWTSDYFNNGNSQACMLWITPEFSFAAGTADKPVIGYFNEAGHKINYYSSLRGIRPMMIEP